MYQIFLSFPQEHVFWVISLNTTFILLFGEQSCLFSYEKLSHFVRSLRSVSCWPPSSILEPDLRECSKKQTIAN